MSVETLREAFPIFKNRPELIYFDSAATALKLESVVKSMTHYYTHESVNIHRSVYGLAESVTTRFEETRKLTAKFINSQSADEIIFTSGTTASVNTLARMVEPHLMKNDEIILSITEHHSNFLPWLELAKRKELTIRYLEPDVEGLLTREALQKLITKKTKLVTFPHVSNVLGLENPILELTKEAKMAGAFVFIDTAQSLAHLRIDVEQVPCDALYFSAHKLFGPTGLGVLYLNHLLHDLFRPVMFGGGMVGEVNRYSYTDGATPHRFEAGTPPIAEVIAFKEALEFILKNDHQEIQRHEHGLTQILRSALMEMEGTTILGNSPNHLGLLTFTMKGIHHQDLGTLLGQMNIMVRSGHHCAKPLMDFFQISGATRLSLSLYNTKEEVYKLIKGLEKARRMLL